MAEPVFTISGLGVKLEGQVAPDLNIAFEQHVDATVSDDEMNEILDRMTRAFWRQQAHPRLIEALIDLKTRRETIETLPKRLAEFDKKQAGEALRIRSSYESQHQMAMMGKRNVVEFVNWPKHAEMLEKLRLHDENTKAKRDEMIREVETYKLELPLIEKRVERQRAILAGADRADAIMDDLPQAAE